MIKTLFKALVLNVKGQFLVWRVTRLIRKRDKLVKKGHYYRALDINHQAEILVKKGKSYTDEYKKLMES